MKYQLIAPVTENNCLVQILLNRGVKKEDIGEYLKIGTSTTCVNEPSAFGADKMLKAVQMVVQHINKNDKTIIIVDPDVDGNTSSALLLNYLHDYFPNWVEQKVDFYFHSGKQHGLNDCINDIIAGGYKFVLCPDAGSNDTVECKKLQEDGIEILILDHHDFDKPNEYALIINNQDKYSNYPNKALSGVGVVWQFCRFFDKQIDGNFANKYLDLVAVGNCADMMDMRSIETAHLIRTGLKELHNPFLYYMAQKNAFKLGSKITPIGAAFYIVPLLNAVQRSGTEEEKQLVFESMLTYKAFEEVPSTKRGHKLGETETIVEQAVRTATNVKNRQTRVQDAAVEALENKIQEDHLLDHKILLILLNDTSNIPAEVRGLIANKFMSKYQRPCCLLTENEGVYQGSARGCSLAGVTDFKQLCVDTNLTQYAVGHPNAFGLSIKTEDVEKFLAITDDELKDMSNEPIYYVDYIFDGQNVDGQILLDIAGMNDYWGTELDEALVAIKGLKVTESMVDIYRNKTLTIKISLPNGVSVMKFNADEELCGKLKDNNTGFVEMDVIGKCNANEWMGNLTPQIFIEDFNIIDSNKYYF